jgi:hypothetical protein
VALEEEVLLVLVLVRQVPVLGQEQVLGQVLEEQ